MLTESKKADRAAMAAQVQAMCERLGAACAIEEEKREISIDISIGDARITISFDGNSPASIRDCYCMPWNVMLGSDAKFSSVFGRVMNADVNPYHRRKCMGFAHGIEHLLSSLESAIECIKSGRAFE